MPAEGIHPADIDRQIVARLPLDVERGVHGIGKLVVPRVGRQIKRNVAVLEAGGIRQSRNASDLDR